MVTPDLALRNPPEISVSGRVSVLDFSIAMRVRPTRYCVVVGRQIRNRKRFYERAVKKKGFT